MALVPILCPQCNASVDIEEGQTIVRCGYCNTSSYLQMPAQPPAPPMRPPPQQPTAAQIAAARQAHQPNKSLLVLVGIIGFVLLVTVGGAVWFSGGTLNHYEDGESAAALLDDKIGKKARYLKIYLHKNYIYVDVLKSDGKIEGRRIRGRELGKAEPQTASSYDQPEKDAFTLKDVDFSKLSKISNHAPRRAKGAKLTALTIQRKHPRQPKLLWQATLDVGGQSQVHYYDLAGKPLAEEKVDFVHATPSDLGKQIRREIGFEPKVTKLYISGEWVRITAIAKGSKRDTDSYRLRNDGVMSGPEPDRNDGNAEELAKAAFSLSDVRWSSVPKMNAAAEKRFDGEKQQAVSIEKRDGQLRYRASVQTKRGAYRYVEFDGDMKETGASKP